MVGELPFLIIVFLLVCFSYNCFSVYISVGQLLMHVMNVTKNVGGLNCLIITKTSFQSQSK
jgi:hypothetical protein